MKLHDQLCSIEQAAELKRLGVTQHSLFYYVNNWLNPRKQPIDNGQFIIIGTEKHKCNRKAEIRGANIEFVSAFTVAELGQLLQDALKKFISQDPGAGGSYLFHLNYSKRFKTEAESMAFLLIEYIYGDTTSVENINKYLNDYNTAKLRMLLITAISP